METNITTLLKSAGLRCTQIRLSVLELLSSVDRPISHQEIGEQSSFPQLDKVTLYRTLDTLHTKGLIHKVLGMDGVARFRAHHNEREKKCGGDHVHFFCRHCEQMSCLPEAPLPWIAPPQGARVDSKQLVVYGVCAQCNGNRPLKGGYDA